MSTTPYPLPAFTTGGGTKVPLAGNPLLFSLMDTPSLRLTVLPDLLQGGFLVSHGRTRIGRLPADFREHYPQIDHLARRGVAPQVTAYVGAELTAMAYFPAPGLIIPLNQPPTEPWALLQGELHEVDTSRGDSAALPVGTAQWLAQASVVNDTVVLSVEGKVVGPIGGGVATVRRVQEAGLLPVVRVFVLSDGTFAEVGETWAENALPPMEPYELHTGQFPVVDAATGTWSITVPEDDVVEAVPDPEPTALPHAPQPFYSGLRRREEPQRRWWPWALLALLIIAAVVAYVLI